MLYSDATLVGLLDQRFRYEYKQNLYAMQY